MPTMSASAAAASGINQRRYGSRLWRTRSTASCSGVRILVVGVSQRTINRFTYSSAKNTSPKIRPSMNFVRRTDQKTPESLTSRNHSRST